MSKRALLVGLNAYPAPINSLRGCLNDLRDVRMVLEHHYGFDEAAGVRTLTDARATTRAIKDGLRWLVAGARPEDVLVFHYSGHGSQVRDRHGDETTDGLDEIICPYDLDWDEPFTDDDLHAIVKDVPPGANLTVILDCCHAGTGLRDTAWAVRCLPPPQAGTEGSAAPPTGGAHEGSAPRQRLVEQRLRRFGRRAAEAGAILLAACRDDQVSADAYIEGEYHGALTFYLCDALAALRFRASYEDVVRQVRRLLRVNGFDQVPQLEGPSTARRAQVFTAMAGSAPPQGM